MTFADTLKTLESREQAGVTMYLYNGKWRTISGVRGAVYREKKKNIDPDMKKKEAARIKKLRLEKKTIIEPPVVRVVKDITKKAYNDNIRRLWEGLSGMSYDGRTGFLTDQVSAVIEYIDDKDSWSIRTKKNYYASIIGTLTRNPAGYDYDVVAKYRYKMDKAAGVIDSEENKNVLNKREKKKAMKWEDVLKLERTPMFNLLSPKQKMVYHIYTKVPPRRVADYQVMKLTRNVDHTDDEEFNWLVINDDLSSTFYFNRFKTEDSFSSEAQVFEVPESLEGPVLEYIENIYVEVGGYLFPKDRSPDNYSPAGFSNLVKDMFKKLSGRALNVNLLRKAKISDFYKTQRSGEDYDALAEKMAHSRKTQEKYAKLDL